jgi:hypothetical protein
MINPELYSFIALFRNKPYQRRKIPKSPREAFVKNEELIQSLERANVIKIYQDIDKNKTEWVFLFTDIAIKTFFPSYLIENIRKEFSGKTLEQKIAIKSLTILEKAYKKN